MAGIYIHIPFCKQACFYCDFHFSVNDKLKQNVVDAICKELEIQKNYLAGANVASVYIGGGTPSLLNGTELKQIMHAVHKHFTVLPLAEITLEANPDDITLSKVKTWKAHGINRLSIGIQSFREEDLKWMNRAHNAQEALQAVGIAKENGIDNLSLDLIYGIPGLSNEDWLLNIEKALALEPSHLSCYALTVEENTPLHKLVKTKRSSAPQDKNTLEHFDILMEEMASKDWEHYEISNFCKKGHRAIHNSNYWKGKWYLGIGPSAHSYNGDSRQWNVSHNLKYIEALNKGMVPFEEENLTISDKTNEYILVSLRTKEGIDMNKIRKLNLLAVANVTEEADIHVLEGNLIKEGTMYYLSSNGKYLADGIASDLFVEG